MATHFLSTDHRLPGLGIVVRLGAVAPGLGPDLLEAVPALREVLMLSTCNRLTFLIDADFWVDTGYPAALRPDLRPADASQPVTTSGLRGTIVAFLAKCTKLPASGLLLTHPVGAAAHREMLAIAAGLSSMVVGEARVVGQVHRAIETVATGGTLNPEFVRIVECTLATAHRVAREAELFGQGRNVVIVGVGQIADHLPSLEDCHALIVGIGSYAGAAVTDLRTRGLIDIAVYSASNRAEAFAAGHDLRAVPAGALSEVMGRANLVVTCHDTSGPILTVDVIAPVAAERTGSAEGVGRPLVILGLALIRDIDEVVGVLPGIVHLDLVRVRNTIPDAEVRQVITVRAIAEAKAADLECTLAGWTMDLLTTALCVRVGRAVAEEAVRLRPQPARRLALAVPAVDGRTETGIGEANSTDAVAGACPHHRLAVDPGSETASEIDGESMVLLAQAKRAPYHLAAHPLHQPTVMVRRAGQEGCEETYRQVLELVWGLENTGKNHG